MSENLFSYAELESSKEIVVETKKGVTESYTPISTNSATSFSNNDLGNVRIVLQDNEPMFCLSDVAKILEIQNLRQLKPMLDKEFDKGGIFYIHPLETAGGKQNFTFINEPELYFVLMRSNSAKAKPFRQWVTKEVLPSIRKLNVPIVNRDKFLPQIQEPTNLQPFNYQGNSLDYGLLNGEPIFNLNAVAGLLGITNPRMSVDTTNSNYVIKVDNSIVSFAYNRKLHNTGELFLTEAGLYMFLMRSNNPNAEPFQLWVTKEVLPSIRKNGGYIAGQENLTDEQLLAKALLVAKNVIENKDKIIQAQKTTIADQKEIINSYKIADRTKRNKQELATLLNRKIRELADKQYNRQYHKAYLAVYEEFAKLHCFTHKVDMQFLKTNIDYLSECLKLVLDKE